MTQMGVCHTHYRTISISIKLLATISLVLDSIPSSLVVAKIECTVGVALPKWARNQFKPVQQSRQQALRGYRPNIYTVHITTTQFTQSRADKKNLTNLITPCGRSKVIILSNLKAKVILAISLQIPKYEYTGSFFLCFHDFCSLSGMFG